MPSFSTEVPHGLGRAVAQDRLASFIDRMVERYQDHLSHIEGVWEGHVLKYTLTALGMKVSGKVIVADDVVRADGELPLAAALLKSKIARNVKEALEAALA